MTPPLSYLALKPVLEYLEVKKRIPLTSRSSFLQRIDKIIPLRANVFWIEEGYLNLDDCRFTAKHEPSYSNENKKNGKILLSYLKQRSSIILDEAYFSNFNTDIPVKLDLTINKLISEYCNHEVVLSMINPRSLPLAELSITVDKPINVDLEIVRSAKNVIFVTHRELIGLETIPNKIVYLIQPVTNVARIIRYWMQNGKEVGTVFSTLCDCRYDLVEMLADLEAEFQEVREKLKEINENFLSGFSIPLSFTSNLLVYGIKKHVYKHTRFELVLKVV